MQIYKYKQLLIGFYYPQLSVARYWTFVGCGTRNLIGLVDHIPPQGGEPTFISITRNVASTIGLNELSIKLHKKIGERKKNRFNYKTTKYNRSDILFSIYWATTKVVAAPTFPSKNLKLRPTVRHGLLCIYAQPKQLQPNIIFWAAVLLCLYCLFATKFQHLLSERLRLSA